MSSGKYSDKSEKDRGLKAAAIIPSNTRLMAKKPKESRELMRPMVTPDPAIAAASNILRLTNGVALPKNSPMMANGNVYAIPVRMPKFEASSGYAVDISNTLFIA